MADALICRSRHAVVAATLAVTALLAAAPANGQSAATLFDRAKTREATLRQTERPTVTAVRSAAATYETVVRRFPRSGYADNALWQAATLYAWAHDLGGQARDRAQAIRVFNWLATQYPASSLAKQASAKAGTLGTTARVTSPDRPSGNTAAKSPAPAQTPRQVPPVSPRTTTPAAAARSTALEPTATLPGLILPAPVTLTAIVVTPLPKGDRLVFELSQESTYTTSRNAASGTVTLHLANVGLSSQALADVATLRGSLIEGVRLTPKNGGTEVEVRVTGQRRHSAFPLYGPYRLVLDVETDVAPTAAMPPLTPPASATVALPAQVSPPPVQTLSQEAPAPGPTTRVNDPRAPTAPATPSAGGYSLARQLGLGVSRIVIDPGHGGHDPGAVAHGVSESELVLDVSMRLERLLLAQPGFEVVLTRRSNEFIALEARTALANRETADLFLSIHANSSPQSGTRGIETYFLNFASNPQAEAVAARENASSAQGMRLLPGLVKAITLNNKREESREFAGMVQASLVRQMKVQNKNVKDLGVKQAPFMVLIGAEMPSVLAEISFITNRADATLLKQSAYRQRVAQALADAVLRYQGSLKKVTPVATTAAGR